MFLLGFFLIMLRFALLPYPVQAIYNPLSTPNNKLGVHILHPDEIVLASKLINNDNQASWGYVTVPITLNDLDIKTWNKFMDQASKLKIIPLLRLTTAPAGNNWNKPASADLDIFANFLDQLRWPVKNRYIIVFNEVNRPNEYGGSVSPEDYTDILSQAIKIFKSHSDKYFILPAALDNAASNKNGFLSWDKYLTRMYKRNPEIFNQIDGWNSHSYPNPAFSASPAVSGNNKIDSFKSDLEFIKQFTARELPIFITETGWSSKNLSPQQIVDNYRHAFVNTWSNSKIVAVTPFLFFADTPPFSSFSLLQKDKTPTSTYFYLQSQATTGSPQLEEYPTPTLIPSLTPTPTTLQPKVLGQTDISNSANFLTKVFIFFKNMLSKFKST